MKRICFCLTALLLLAAASCGSEQTPAADTASADTTVSVTTAAETAPPEHIIEPMDLGGAEFMFFGVEPHNNDWQVNTYSEAFSAGENGDLINDAIFRRNIEIEEAYNIKIAAVGTTRDRVGADAVKVIMSGDDTYDVINMPGANLSTVLAEENVVCNLAEIDSIDLTRSFWDQNSVSDLTLYDSLYAVSGDLNLRTMFSPTIMIFNRKMIEDYALSDPYTLAADGTWTIDAMLDMCKTVSADVNGDGKLALEDKAGFFGEAISVFWGINAFGERIITMQNGEPVLTLNSERTVAAVEFYVDLMRSGDYAIFSSDISPLFPKENIWRTRMLPMLEQNQLLFSTAHWSTV